jgi:hypothetical protein
MVGDSITALQSPLVWHGTDPLVLEAVRYYQAEKLRADTRARWIVSQ